MHSWKSIPRICYYTATLPYRWWLRRVAEAEHRAPVVVLAYHRVADDLATRWTVSNRMFARQIDWLAGRFDLISLAEAQRRLLAGDNCQTAACITFDDGYAENCHQAIPLLVKRRIPSTYFVTVKNVLDGVPFDHDLAVGKPSPPNTPEQLRAMADAGVEIGSHGYEHIGLGSIDDRRELTRQVLVSRERLQDVLGRPVRYFAFPYGHGEHLNPNAMDMACEAGYEGVCSCYGGYNFPGDDPAHLQRTPVDESMSQLKNCVSIDPRKLHTWRFPWKRKRSTQTHTVGLRGPGDDR